VPGPEMEISMLATAPTHALQRGTVGVVSFKLMVASQESLSREGTS
jgi:hypothetical protein